MRMALAFRADVIVLTDQDSPVPPVKFLSFLLVALMVSASALAEPAAEPPQGHALTLPELTDLALSNNPNTRSAWAVVAQSEAAESIARAGYWPVLTGTISWQRNQALSTQGQNVPPQIRYGPSISMSYLLFDFGSRSGQIQRAVALTLAARFMREQTLQDLMLLVESAYYSVVGARALETASRRSVEEAQANAEAARVRHDAGLATISDLYQAQAALAAAQLSLQQNEGARVIADGALAVALGYSPDTALTLSEWQSPWRVELPNVKIGELMASADQARPDLLAAQAREQAATQAVRAARGQGLPRLTLSGSIGRTTIEGISTSETNAAGFQLIVPLFNGFADLGALAQARALVNQAQADADSLRLSVRQQVWVAYQNVITAQKNLDAAHAQLGAASKAAEAVQARYKSGLSTILEVLSTEATLAQARVADIQAGVSWFQSLATLAHDGGSLRTASMGVLP